MELSAYDLQAIEEILQKYPDTGERYNEANNRFVDKLTTCDHYCAYYN
ncbi:hypothetical protein [Hufsiella ginkgonis]|uniref:Uncharacterized protein n=1 Tax=Hufsiella ginkgonis TaxID=2695274 RepID=A0A7K1Y027_9SPHI|nr:hypothetical protein [Hufsiella ginkgonis]MXV16621.1 hypothetical protein [Hufsiella ginkgonis]